MREKLEASCGLLYSPRSRTRMQHMRADIEMMADGIGHGDVEQETQSSVGHAQKIEVAVPPVDLRGAPSACQRGGHQKPIGSMGGGEQQGGGPCSHARGKCPV